MDVSVFLAIYWQLLLFRPKKCGTNTERAQLTLNTSLNEKFASSNTVQTAFFFETGGTVKAINVCV